MPKMSMVRACAESAVSCAEEQGPSLPPALLRAHRQPAVNDGRGEGSAQNQAITTSLFLFSLKHNEGRWQIAHIHLILVLLKSPPRLW